MIAVRWRSWLRALLVAVLLITLVVVGFGLYLAGEAGRLPWQADPTRIPITPFADIPGFGAPTAVASPESPVASAVATGGALTGSTVS